jgi:hypothetical protein
VVAGLLTLFVVYRFLCKVSVGDNARFFLFSLVALNPDFAGINAQVTNDSFVILFSTLTIYLLYEFLEKKSFKTFIVMLLSMVLALLSKSTALTLFLGIVFILGVRALCGWSDKVHRNSYLAYLIISVLLVSSAVSILGEYYYEYRLSGTLLRFNAQMYPPPYFLDETFYSRPGVTSIDNSYLSFMFLDLMEHPTITNGLEIIPEHRASLWTQIYGRTNFIYFAAWPNAWSTENKYLLWLGRVTFLLALLPLILFIYGYILNLLRVFQGARLLGREYFCWDTRWIFPFLAICYLAFIILFTAFYRDFSCMKAIYLYPGILAFLYVVGDGWLLVDKISRIRILGSLLNAWFFALLLCYVINVLALVMNLSFKV